MVDRVARIVPVPSVDAPLTLAEAAAYLRCHPSTLKRRVARSEVAVSRRGRLLFRRADLDAYLAGARSEARAATPGDGRRPIRPLGPVRINPLTREPYATEVAARIEQDIAERRSVSR